MVYLARLRGQPIVRHFGKVLVESNGKDPLCTVCGGNLKYRDRVRRIMKKYNGERSCIMIERRKCQNPACKKLHRCLPPQLTKFKHFATEIIEDTVDDVVIPEDPDGPEEEFIESPSSHTVTRWKQWIEKNTANINNVINLRKIT